MNYKIVNEERNGEILTYKVEYYPNPQESIVVGSGVHTNIFHSVLPLQDSRIKSDENGNLVTKKGKVITPAPEANLPFDDEWEIEHYQRDFAWWRNKFIREYWDRKMAAVGSDVQYPRHHNTTFNANVVASTDDARNIDGDGTFTATATTQHLGIIKVGAPYLDYWNGFRWNSVTIPQGATINSASLDIYSAQVTSGTTAKTIWYGVDEDDVTTFSNTTANKPEGKTRTTATVSKDFDVATWAATQGFGVDPFSVTSLVQEIVDRGGWTSGNNMAIVGHDNGSGASANNYVGHSTYDRATDRGAALSVDYTAGGGGGGTRSMRQLIGTGQGTRD